MANRLFVYGHFLAFGRENGIKIVNSDFNDLAACFNRKRFLFAQLLKPLIYIAARIGLINEIFFADKQSNSRQNHNRLIEKKVVFVRGWYFRVHQLFSKHAEYIRQELSINRQIVEKIDELLAEITQPDTIKVEVHVRRGDYAVFADGKYFYNDSEYLAAMQQTLQRVAKGAAVHFLLVSNEPLQQSHFQSQQIKSTHVAGSPIEDLCLLSRLDYIIGPPSTFSAWASFYGGKPLARINKNPDGSIKIDRFIVHEG